jgi:hypothetical protein
METPAVRIVFIDGWTFSFVLQTSACIILVIVGAAAYLTPLW